MIRIEIMEVSLIDEDAKVEIEGRMKTDGRRQHLTVTKNKIGLKPGLAGGSIRNFRVSEAPAKD